MNTLEKVYQTDPFGAFVVVIGACAFLLGFVLWINPRWREDLKLVKKRNTEHTARLKIRIPWAYDKRYTLTQLPRPEVPTREIRLMLLGAWLLVMAVLSSFLSRIWAGLFAQSAGTAVQKA